MRNTEAELVAAYELANVGALKGLLERDGEKVDVNSIYPLPFKGDLWLVSSEPTDATKKKVNSFKGYIIRVDKLASTYCLGYRGQDGIYIEYSLVEPELIQALKALDYDGQGEKKFYNRDVESLLTQLNAIVIAQGGRGLGSRDRKSLLGEAAARGRETFVDVLLANNAAINQPDTDGMTPLHDAVLQGKVAIARNLLEKRGDVNHPDDSGNTPLHRAAEDGHVELVRLLFAHYASVSCRNYSNETALDCATRRGAGSDVTVEQANQCKAVVVLYLSHVDLDEFKRSITAENASSSHSAGLFKPAAATTHPLESEDDVAAYLIETQSCTVRKNT